MRILHVISRFNRGGTATWLNNLVTEQRKQGDEVSLIAGLVQNNETEDENFNHLGGTHIESLGRKISPFDDIKALLKIRSQIKTFKPDIINTHTSKAGLLGRLAAITLNNRPAIVHTYHGHLLYGYYGKFTTKLFSMLEFILSFFTDAFIVSGENVKRDLESAKVLRDKNIFLARPGILVPDLKKIRLNEKDTLVVGWLGRLTKIKRPDRLLELAKKFPSVIFLVGGEGELEKELRKIAPANVQFLGWVNSFDFWQKCDVALLTSENEAQPISLVEAALCSLPSIAENVGSVSNVVTHQKTGLLVNNFEDRVTSLNTLMSDPKLRLKMGNEARKDIEGKFSINQFIASHNEAYKSALKRK